MNAEGQIGRGGVEGVSAEEVTPSQSEQYSLAKILGIWAVVAMPMAILAWVIAPAVIPRLSLHYGITYWLLIIAGMMWQFVVALVVLRQELGTLRWGVLRKRLWLNLPRDPQTGRFFLIDLSSLGTTLNGRHVPRGYDEVDGTKRENGTETVLPDHARIGLAGIVYLQFDVVP